MSRDQASRGSIEEPEAMFLGPWHVSMVIGTVPYGFIPQHYKKPIVVAGFEPLDILQSIAMVVRQLAGERCVVENQYRRIVPEAPEETVLLTTPFGGSRIIDMLVGEQLPRIC